MKTHRVQFESNPVKKYTIMSFIQVGILLVFICTFSSGAVSISWEERFAQLETKYYQLEQSRATLLEKYNEDREELAAQVTELKAKVQQQETILSALLNDKKEPSSEVSSINGLPSSCSDLKMIGHIWSGFYSIVGSTMMESVYCDFTKLPSDPGFQKWIGYSDVKSAPVHFYVQRNTNFNTKLTPIPFDVAVVNEGNAMNLTTGIFTAPRNGIYFFSFVGHAYFLAYSVYSDYVRLGINLVLNDAIVAMGWVDEGHSDDVNSTVNTQVSPVTVQSTLNLKKDDRVWVRISSIHGEGYFYDNYSPYHFTHFMGFMLQEEIAASL